MDLLEQQGMVLMKEGNISISTEQFEPKESKAVLILSTKSAYWKPLDPEEEEWSEEKKHFLQVSYKSEYIHAYALP